MKKLNLSVGILSWGAPKTLYNTLESYKQSGIFDMVDDIKVFFQEASPIDKAIAKYYNLYAIANEYNVGIGKGLKMLAMNASTDNILLLENDWVNIEPANVTYEELQKGIDLLDSKSSNMVKYRHRTTPGEPLYSRQYCNREMNSPKHLLECVHWRQDPDIDFPDYIWKDSNTGYYCATSKYANHTNNPTMFNTKFYMDNIAPFSGTGNELEGKIDGWWQEQDFVVSHGKGLFTHLRLDR
jgi:hypothetical protein